MTTRTFEPWAFAKAMDESTFASHSTITKDEMDSICRRAEQLTQDAQKQREAAKTEEFNPIVGAATTMVYAKAEFGLAQDLIASALRQGMGPQHSRVVDAVARLRKVQSMTRDAIAMLTGEVVG
jgi:hypothetical protein